MPAPAGQSAAQAAGGSEDRDRGGFPWGLTVIGAFVVVAGVAAIVVFSGGGGDEGARIGHPEIVE